jgi:hypothetical protein
MNDISAIDHIKKYLGIKIIYKINHFLKLFLKSFGLGFNTPNWSYERLGDKGVLYYGKHQGQWFGSPHNLVVWR